MTQIAESPPPKGESPKVAPRGIQEAKQFAACSGRHGDGATSDQLVQAQLFVERLAGRSDAHVTLVAIRQGDTHPPARRDQISALWDWVSQEQHNGRGIYVTVNETQGVRRTKAHITAGRAVWIDDDTPRDRPRVDWPMAPHMVVESSPGKFHYYWLTRYTPGPAAEALMRRMIAEHPGADPGVWNIDRVLRLPGTVNLKEAAAGHVARIVHIDDRAPYTFDELETAWPAGAEGEAPRLAFDKAAALRTIESGAPGMHDALRDLAAHEVATGKAPADVKAELLDLIGAIEDGSARFRERKADIARLVDSAAAKFTPVQPTADGFGDEPIVESSTAAKPKEQATHHGYALALLKRMREEAGGYAPVGAEGVIYTPNAAGQWVPHSMDAVAVAVARAFDGRKKCERRSDYTAIAAHAYGLCEQTSFFDGAPLGLAGPDGFFRVSPEGAVVHEALTPDHRQRHMHPVSPKRGNRPLFDRYLAQTFASQLERETEQQIAFVQEVAGATALGLMADQEKVVLLYGPGRAGKGTLLKVLEALVPPDSRASVTPVKWDNEYYLATLARKLFNAVGELPDDQPLPAASFKTVTGRDLLTGRHPTHRPFTFRNEASHVFNSNVFPSTRDHSTAFFERWLIVSFPNSRIGSGGIETDLAARIVAEELPAILAWAIEGAQRLVKRGRFEPTDAHRRHLAAWQRRTDSVMEFLHDEDVCMLDDFGIGLRVRRAVLYHGYTRWCADAGRRPIGKQKFNEALDTPTMSALGVRVVRTAEAREVVHGVWLRDAYDAF